MTLIGCGAQQRPDGGQGYLPAGSQAPDLTSADHHGKEVRLHDASVTLVYFYPRAGTPGCTKEACAFRDAWRAYEESGVRVLGVSSDPAARLAKFASTHNLPFSLIPDSDHRWSKAFGVGTFMGFDARVSFLLDDKARVAKVYEDVDPGVHADEVLRDIAQLGLTRKPSEAEQARAEASAAEDGVQP